MKTIPVARASAELASLIEQVSADSEPVQIAGERDEAVLVSAADWRSIQETLYLSSIPGMKESIIAGMNAPAEEFSEDPGWNDAGE